MFELNEAVRGRLIGPKTWDRIVRNFFGIFLTIRDSPENLVDSRAVWVDLSVHSCVNHVLV